MWSTFISVSCTGRFSSVEIHTAKLLWFGFVVVGIEGRSGAAGCGSGVLVQLVLVLGFGLGVARVAVCV